METSTGAAIKNNATGPAQNEGGNGDWQQAIDEMALTGLVRELVDHCVLKEQTEERVHLVLIPAQGHLLKTTQKERLQKAIKARFGPDVTLLITVEEPATETPARMRGRKEDERQQAAVQSFENDPEVRAMLETFNGTLDRDSIQAQ